MKTKRASRKKLFGKYIVADPEICHGQVTFVGTRIFVADVLELVSLGYSWNKIIKEAHGSITKDGIAEAVRLAGRAFLDHAEKYVLELECGPCIQ